MTPPKSMRALQLVAPNTLKQVVRPVPQPRPDEILVRTVATTLCTSDLNDIAHNPFGIALPRVLGHEGAGIVQAVGQQVESFAVGDPVAVHPVIPCRQCENCQRGLGHLCTQMGHLGLDRDGTFAEYFCIRADRARRASNKVLPFACLLEPVAVCLEAVQRGRIEKGNNVLVVGDGPFGIIIARLAGRLEPSRLILVGRHDFRLRQVPGAIALNEQCSSSASVAERVAQIHKLNDGLGLDVAIMAAGTQSALDLCVAALRARGRAVVFSAIAGRATLDLFRVHTHELEILGACNDQNLIDPALASLNDSDLQLSSLITHRIPFDDWPRAFDLARGRKDEALKVALTFDV
jgi:threonine dehydrogenase-like Zn-dependent dehydrogenase